jgi:hypothetical protein
MVGRCGLRSIGIRHAEVSSTIDVARAVERSVSVTTLFGMRLIKPRRRGRRA